MAHKGQKFKVWFRRDFNLHSDDKSKWFPEAFVLGFIGWESSFWNLARCNDRLIFNLSKASGTTRLWVSDPIIGGGATLTEEIEVIGNEWDIVQTFHWRIRVFGGFRILDVIYETLPHAKLHAAFQSGSAPTIVVQDQDITFDVDNNTVACTFAPYSRYDP